jgi:hypothetical protein
VSSPDTTNSVAPAALASSSFPGVTSTATICPAPAIRAACSTASPTPPTPYTTTVPAPSCPNTAGTGCRNVPFVSDKSE